VLSAGSGSSLRDLSSSNDLSGMSGVLIARVDDGEDGRLPVVALVDGLVNGDSSLSVRLSGPEGGRAISFC
jgi:hypothetical protein